MKQYNLEEKLNLAKRIGVTQEVYDLLRKIKRKSNKEGKVISMAKIVCNTIIEKYDNSIDTK